MLRKNSSYITKTFLSRLFSVLKIKKVKVILFSLFFVVSVNQYNYSHTDYLLIKTLRNPHIVSKVKQISKNYGVDPLLVSSVIVSESSAYPFAVSHKNAKGLMQLMIPTALCIAKSKNKKLYKKMKDNPGIIYSPDVNIELAVIHLKNMKTFDGNWSSTLHIYNVGGGAYRKGKRNYKYVHGILKRLKRWKG